MCVCVCVCTFQRNWPSCSVQVESCKAAATSAGTSVVWSCAASIYMFSCTVLLVDFILFLCVTVFDVLVGCVVFTLLPGRPSCGTFTLEEHTMLEFKED
jgi:hypothetical protein